MNKPGHKRIATKSFNSKMEGNKKQQNKTAISDIAKKCKGLYSRWARGGQSYTISSFQFRINFEPNTNQK